MTLTKKLKTFIDEAKGNDSYWVESAKLDFALTLERQRRRAQVSYANIAKAMGASAAYVSKVFRGDSNLTIESMVKLARATGGELDIRIINNAITAVDWNVSKHQHLRLVPGVTPNGWTQAANEPVDAWDRSIAA